jgi:hypothetical protein
MPADGIPLPFAISGDVGTSRPEEQLLIETIQSNAHPKDLISACAEQAIRPNQRPQCPNRVIRVGLKMSESLPLYP